MCNYCTDTKLCYYHKKIKDGLIDPPEDTPEDLAQAQQIWNYMPLVKSTTTWLTAYTTIEHQELCQQGYLILAELAFKVDWSLDPQEISKYINLSLIGQLKSYLAQHGQIIRIPAWNATYFDMGIELVDFDEEATVCSDTLNPEEEYLAAEQTEQVNKLVQKIQGGLNERELYVLWHTLLTDDPVSYREIAEEFGCSHVSIYRDYQRVLNLFRKESVSADL